MIIAHRFPPNVLLLLLPFASKILTALIALDPQECKGKVVLR